MITFISGGARSGKSKYAERKAVSTYKEHLHDNRSARLCYIATSKRSDVEMEERIRLHQKMRGEVEEWETHEESYDFSLLLCSCHSYDVLLIDCLTIWINNVMFDLQYSLQEIEEIVNRWIMIAKQKHLHLIFVSNDVNEGLPHTSKDVLRYMYTLQHVHKIIVQHADDAIQVIAGIPIYWKGGGQ
ncbi:bifunctional adenosylcobinamide kinase/adenosylcobinamide-phosphate guanylyltransferase [Halalkalibacter okhensis]|uniref:Adenosylcobinamide kinase n=1 Tax=Halalkalibacter okhensis TaxID=333138 RepID=A0A0B0IDT7_9BACI|nr:bifunctional adenosylcobinamide kinase/adenosylcobinamide-phosphate guanylyltransferase [Halalkalibacter okhensis]KHF40753.1 hypothetical protein LQ50_08200 [Halalkalibacter okhensis]